MDFLEKSRELQNLPKNWDSYGADPPNEVASNYVELILRILSELEFSPTKVTPSVENGIAVSFINNQKYADIECFNDGEILAVVSNRQGNIEVWEVQTTPDKIKSALLKIRAFLQSDKIDGQ